MKSYVILINKYIWRFMWEIYEKINTGLKQIEEGKYVSAKQAFKELEEKYELWKNIMLI